MAFNNFLNSYVSYYCQPCYYPTFECIRPKVIFTITLGIPTTIPTSTPGVPIPTIPVGQTMVTNVTPLIGFIAVPISNIGGIIVNSTNGQFIIPIVGQYSISAYITFSNNSIGQREIGIYKIDASNIITLLASSSKTASQTGVTSITVSTVATLNAGDKIFFAAAQNSGSSLIVINGKFDIVRLCPDR